MSNAARDRIVIHDLKVACVIGIRPEERHREQPLTVNLELEVDSRPAGRSGKISETVNYAEVAQEIGALLRFRRYRLLEMAAEELSAMIFGVHPEVHGLTLELAKPRALEGRAASASVRVSRRPEDFPRRHEDNEFGQVDVLFESREAGLYLLHIEPGKCIPSHYHQVMRELEWVVRGEIARDGKALEGLAPVAWAKGRVHRYDNLGETRATLFCCDHPPFIRDDEIPARAEGGPIGPAAQTPSSTSKGDVA